MEIPLGDLVLLLELEEKEATKAHIVYEIVKSKSWSSNHLFDIWPMIDGVPLTKTQDPFRCSGVCIFDK